MILVDCTIKGTKKYNNNNNNVDDVVYTYVRLISIKGICFIITTENKQPYYLFICKNKVHSYDEKIK